MAYGFLAVLSTFAFFAGAVNPASFLSVVYAAGTYLGQLIVAYKCSLQYLFRNEAF